MHQIILQDRLLPEDVVTLAKSGVSTENLQVKSNRLRLKESVIVAYKRSTNLGCFAPVALLTFVIKYSQRIRASKGSGNGGSPMASSKFRIRPNHCSGLFYNQKTSKCVLINNLKISQSYDYR